MSQEKNQVAWDVRENEEGRGTIVFHHHSMAARRIGAERLEVEFEYTGAIRSPEFDGYAEQGKVPLSALLKHGWWQECCHCRRKVDLSDEVLKADEVIIDDEAGAVFCNEECRVEFDLDVKLRNAKFEAFKLRVQEIRPDLEFYEFQGGFPWITLVGKFRFPGCKYGGSVRDQDGKEQLTWFISGGDQEAWERYEEGRVRTDA